MAGDTKSKPEVRSFDALEFNPRFEYGEQAEVAVVSNADDMTELGTGFGRLKNANIPWTIKYDEVILVVEGTLTIETESGKLTANARDSVWLPKGTKLIYTAEDALIFYAIHPNNWAEASS